MKYHVRNLLSTPAPPAASYPSLEAAQEAVESWIERHVYGGESLTILAGTHIVDDKGAVLWQARGLS